MWKYIAIPLTSFLIIALIIGQCNDDSSDYDDEEEEVTSAFEEKKQPEDLSQKDKPRLPDDIPSAENAKQGTKRTPNDALQSQDPKSQQKEPEILHSAYEIPRLMVPVAEQILVREGYTTSYNPKTKNANWVAWHLTREHTSGPWSRKGIPYLVDKEVKGPRQELEDYHTTTLPIDHGHMCPAGDNKWSAKAIEQTFLLTNICPQNSALNRGDWEELESRCRGWANHYGEIWIACGPIFNEGYKTIGNGVGVPDAFYKVVLRMGKSPQTLGFIYTNDGTSNKLSHYLVSVDEVEEITGIDFFFILPDEIENMIEASSNLKEW